MQKEVSDGTVAKLVAQMKEWKCGKAVDEFEAIRTQVLNGAMEASHNYGTLRQIEAALVTLSNPQKLSNTSLLFPGVMSTLQALHSKSSFYHESRLISLIDKIGTSTFVFLLNKSNLIVDSGIDAGDTGTIAETTGALRNAHTGRPQL